MSVANKFAVIYSFKIIDGKEKDFINAWTALTQLIYKFEGSYGSRLHKTEKQLFIAYAQWPDKETWEQSGAKLPAKANELRKQMRESCSLIKTEFAMQVVQDLLTDKKYKEL